MKSDLTYEELHRQLFYDPLTGILIWKISNKNRVKKGNIAGTKHNGYIEIGIKGKVYKAHRLAWVMYYGYWPENDIDHKDKIKHHNCIRNLRETSRQCNMRNMGNRKDNTSGVKGIHWDKLNKKWKTQISINRKRKTLGYYKDFDNAVCARLAGEQCVGWEGCDSNSPAYQYVKENIQ